MRYLTLIATGFVLLTVLLTPAKANDVIATFKRLIQSRSLKCTFVEGAQGDWSNGRLKISTIKNEKFVLHFDSIDAKKGTARLIGNNGAADLYATLTLESLSFIEQTPSGNINVTTVFPFYGKGSQAFVAVTSRHLMLPGIQGESPFPSQRYGTCQVWE